MRPLPFVLGLLFVATVLIPNVDAIQCYVGLGNDVEGRFEGECRSGITACYKFDGELDGKHRIVRGRAGPDTCNRTGMQCCSSDLCNGD